MMHVDNRNIVTVELAAWRCSGREEDYLVRRRPEGLKGGDVRSEPPILNAFTREFISLLRDKDELGGPWGAEAPGPLVILEAGGRFGLFRPWHRPEAGDTPEAELDSVEDARLFLAARLARRYPQFYELQSTEQPPCPEGHAVRREGETVGYLRNYDPYWVYACHVLAAVAQSPEDLAAVLQLAGPTTLEEVGEILGRAAASGPGGGKRGGDPDATEPEPFELPRRKPEEGEGEE
jgi:hypothetical protein